MCEKILRKKIVIKRLGVSDTTFWRMIQSEAFPKAVLIKGSSIKGWSESTVNKWIADNFLAEEENQ